MCSTSTSKMRAMASKCAGVGVDSPRTHADTAWCFTPICSASHWQERSPRESWRNRVSSVSRYGMQGSLYVTTSYHDSRRRATILALKPARRACEPHPMGEVVHRFLARLDEIEG